MNDVQQKRYFDIVDGPARHAAARRRDGRERERRSYSQMNDADAKVKASKNVPAAVKTQFDALKKDFDAVREKFGVPPPRRLVAAAAAEVAAASARRRFPTTTSSRRSVV